MKEFGRNFKDLRIADKKSQLDMAKIFNVTQATISGWETGRKIPEVPMLITVAKYFGVSVDYLLDLDLK